MVIKNSRIQSVYVWHLRIYRHDLFCRYSFIYPGFSVKKSAGCSPYCIERNFDYEKDFNGTYFLSKSLWQYMWDLEELWKKGIPGRIAYDPEYVLDGRKHPENYCLIECRCGKLIMVPRYTGDMILETTCPICDLPWQYENERPKYPYCDGMYGVVCDYTPVYKIPK